MHDEFAFLAGDAEWVGRIDPLPHVARHSHRLSDGRMLSALHFDADAEAPLLLLHGAGLNAHSFDPVVLALGTRAVAIDLAGHGKSDWRDDAQYSPRMLATDVIEAIEAWELGPVHVAGQSLGGLTAAAIVDARPDLALSVTLIDITPGITPARDAGSVNEFLSGQRSFTSIDEMIDRAIEFGIGNDREALRKGVTLNARKNADGLFEWIHHLAHLDAAVSHADTTAEQPFRELWLPLAQQEHRVTLVCGSAGMLNEALTDEWKRQLPLAKVQEIAGGHNLQEQNPVALAEVIRRVIMAG